MTNDSKVSALIKDQFPNFVKSDHPKIIAFLEAYYEWRELAKNATDANRRLLDFQDIDTTLDEFIVQFKREFMANIPTNVLVDKRLLLKHIKQFYKSRGNEKSYRFLFRILFDTEIDFRYPNQEMLRLSDGKWIKEESIKVCRVTGDPFDLAGRKVKGRTSGAEAAVEIIRAKQVGNNFVYELFLNRSSLKGRFEPQEIAFWEDIEVKVHTLLEAIVVEEGFGGKEYKVGDPVEIISDGSGFEAKAEVGTIEVLDVSDPQNPTGSVKTVLIKDFGVDYLTPPIIQFETKTIQAQGIPVLGAHTNYPGFFLNSDGKLSDVMHIQDSFFYQQFSYVLKVGETIDFYRDIVLKLLHPAGLKLFGQVAIISSLENRASLVNENSFVTLTLESLVNAGIQSQQTLVRLEETVQEGENQFKLGPSLRSLDRNKFFYLPTEEREDIECPLHPNPQYPTGEPFPLEVSRVDSLFRGGLNIGYWDSFANTPICHIEDLIIEDIEDRPWKRLNIMPAPVLKNDI